MSIFKNYARWASVLLVAFLCMYIEPKSITGSSGAAQQVQPPAKPVDLGQKRTELVREASLARVQKEQEKKAGIDTRSLQAIQDSMGPDLFTQTEAYFQVPKLRKLVTEEFTGYFKVVEHMDVVSSIMAKEAELRKSHWAFYHGVDNIWTVPQDLYTKLHNHFHPEDQKRNEDFIFLRFTSMKGKAPKEFLIGELKQHGLVDDNNEAGGLLLAVNFTPFGNTSFKGESTWKYFIEPHSHVDPDRAMYELIMNEFKLPHTYIDELMALTRDVRSKHQTLLQIFVPKNLVDNVGYLAWVTGIPAHEETIDWVRKHIKHKGHSPKGGKSVLRELASLKDKFKKEQEKNALFRDMLESIEKGEDYSVDAYLKDYCNKPEEIPQLNYVQARLIFSDDVLLNPASGVKMFRHNKISNEKIDRYETKLEELVKKIVASKR